MYKMHLAIMFFSVKNTRLIFSQNLRTN